MAMSEAQEQKAPEILDLNPDEEADETPETVDAVGFKPDENGIYHWIYAMDMKKDKSILYLILKIMGVIMGLLYLFLVFVTAKNHGRIQDILMFAKVLIPVFLVIVAICYFSYWLVSLEFGGTYNMLYDMEEEGVRFSQTWKQAQTPEEIGKEEALAGTLSHNYGLIGVSGAGGANEMYSKFSEVRRITIDRKNHMIGLKHLVMYNIVYADEPYFEGIADYILKRCINAKIVIKN